VKNSLLSLIQGIQVTDSNGTVIVNEQKGSTWVRANLELLLDSSLDFMASNELMYFGHDKNVPREVRGNDRTVIDGAGPSASTAFPENDPRKNPPYANRIAVFRARSAEAGAGPYTRTFIAYLPLRFIHSFFEQMNFPLTQLPLVLQFNINGCGTYTQACPWQCPEFSAYKTLGAVDATLGAVAGGVAPTTYSEARDQAIAAVNNATLIATDSAAAKPSAEIVKGVAERGGSAWTTGPRLFVKSVVLHEKEAQTYIAKAKSKHRHAITYTVADWTLFKPNDNGPTAGVVGVDQLIAPSVVRPSRVWVFPLDRTKSAVSLHTSSFPAAFSRTQMSNVQMQINNTPFYAQQIKSQYELYKLLQTQMTAGFGHSPITYTEFLNGINPYVFPLDRSDTINSNTTCQLQLQCDLSHPTGAVPVTDLWVLIERLETMIFEINESGVVVLVRQGAE
jgi:hypothetical protein